MVNEAMQRQFDRSTDRRSRAVWLALTWLLAILCLCGGSGAYTRVRDIARPLGERNNKLVGAGLVFGLNGTGDGAALMTMRPLKELFSKMGNPAELEELVKAGPKNIAYVTLTADLGRYGVCEGDQIDVHVHSYAAKSLAGGTLWATPLTGTHPADDSLYAIAQGPISIPDSDNPTSGVIRSGAIVEENVYYLWVDRESYPGRAIFTLVLDDKQASWLSAKQVAGLINDEMAPVDYGTTDEQITADIARVRSPRIIEISLSAKQADNPAPFIARIMSVPVDMPDPEAVVVINRKTGVIAITGNVEIAPVVVSVNGMTIRVIKPLPEPAPGRPVVTETAWAPFDTANSSGVKLKVLTDALDLLKVPTEDRINAIYAISNAGALRARIKTEN